MTVNYINYLQVIIRIVSHSILHNRPTIQPPITLDTIICDSLNE